MEVVLKLWAVNNGNAALIGKNAVGGFFFTVTS